MQCRRILAGGAATITLASAIIAAAAAATAVAAGGTTVTVRVEGKARTLLPATTVRTHVGSITKGGVASGKCPAASAQGALDVASRHRWGGSFSTSFGNYLIKTILGETDNGPRDYWNIWVNNRYATTGACQIKLHAHDQLLFAAATYPSYPLGLSGPSRAAVGHSFKAKLVWFNSAGKSKPLAGARVTGSGVSALTNNRGIAIIKPSHAGRLLLGATRAGYVRPATLRVRVSP